MELIDYLPVEVTEQIDNAVPELSVHEVDDLGWGWTYREAESEDYFDSREECYLDFLIDFVIAANQPSTEDEF
jgi:hypothetical protein